MKKTTVLGSTLCKRILAIMLCVCMLVMACGCKSKAAVAADKLISAIGEVTIDSGDAISEAEKAVNLLDTKELESLEYISVWDDAKKEYEIICAVTTIEKKISEIGTVTLDSGSAISIARTAYNKASSDIQNRVSNYSELESKENEYHQLKAEYRQSKANAVIDAINKIGNVDVNSASVIEEARSLYNELSDDEASLVTNIDELNKAESSFKSLITEKASAIESNFKTDYDQFQNATFYYHNNIPKYINDRCYILPYIVVYNGQSRIRIVFVYTGDEWVFFKKIYVSVDGKNYTNTFDYFDITRDNNYGDVWEYIDVVASDEQIEMLKAMATSNETVIRYEGDSARHDITLSDKDKQTISEILIFNEYLNLN